MIFYALFQLVFCFCCRPAGLRIIRLAFHFWSWSRVSHECVVHCFASWWWHAWKLSKLCC